MRVLLLVCSAAIAAGGEPQVVFVEESRGTFVVPVTDTEYREVQKQVTRQVDGRAEVQTVTEKTPVTVTKYVVIDATAGDFLDRAGRPLDPKAVAALLKKGAVLAVAPDGTAIEGDVLKKNEKIEAILLLKPMMKDRGPAPMSGTVERDAAGRVLVEITITDQVPTQQTRTRRHQGRTVTEVVTVPVTRTYKTRHDLADAKAVTDLGGNPVDVKALRPGSRVAVSADYRPVDPSHVQELKGVVAVIVLKETPVP
ncbi:MAG TPA: hypothetical protein VM597_22020 [Gemmataceae bacterium]|jgi:hypothetical protein|nr:hypothetical protein [Gemmataceae bacterium]